MNPVDRAYLREVIDDFAAVSALIAESGSDDAFRLEASAERAFQGLFWSRCESILREGWFETAGRRYVGFGKAVQAVLPRDERPDPLDVTGLTLVRFTDLLPRERNRLAHDHRSERPPLTLPQSLEVAEDFFARIEPVRPTVRPSP